MGLVRTLLALSVLLNHTWPFAFLLASGRIPVQLFFIISGFLISYVLVEKKTYTKKLNFYINRFLRLFPLYVLVAAVTLAYFIIVKKSDFFDIYKIAPFYLNFYLYLANFFILFQDLSLYMDLSPNSNNLYFQINFINSNVPIYKAMLLPQAWSISLEILFYLISPFILFSKKRIVICIIFSILIRCYLIYLGIGNKDPWVYRFFPSELLFFLSGALSHQIIKPFYENHLKNLKKYSLIATLYIALFILFYYKLNISEPYKNVILFVTFTLFLPLLFVFDDFNNISKYLGGLSYPIYISHYFIYLLVFDLFKNLSNFYLSFLVIVLCILFSFFAIRFVDTKFEFLRNKYRE